MGTHHAEPLFWLDGTEIKIATGSRGNGTPGKSQTINISSHEPQYRYQQVYRLYGSAQYVSRGDILAHARNLHELDVYLTARGAVKEGPR